MIQQIYAWPLGLIGFIMLLLLAGWSYLSEKREERKWMIGNGILTFFILAFILYTTLLTRTPGDYEVVLAPFAALAAARQQPELYREMLMNVFLFFPFGLTLSNALPRRWNHWLRIGVTTLVGCLLSAGIEYAQYRFSLGMAETDDVLCNTLGALLGAGSLLPAHAIENHKKGHGTRT